ncbi:MAG TPA: polysaccharide deacetylase family protein [Nevskiaceae bacterium]|nr:polysaccharide deacetylase family protein [Nevskiaceae bacterium]
MIRGGIGKGVKPQILVSGMAGLLCLMGLLGVQRHAIISSVYQGPQPVIASTPYAGSGLSPKNRVEAVDCSLTPCLALTFDDGPNPVTTPQILDILEAYDARATFFVIGSRVPGHEALLQRMFQDGFEIGNHSWSHPDLTKLSSVQVRQQVEQTQTAVINAGVPAPRLFRPPYGAVNPMVKSQIPLTLVMWNVDPEDWQTPDVSQIIAKVEAQAKPGGMVVMHDIHAQTAQALPTILDNLEDRFQLVTVSDLFNLAPGQRGEYFGR